ncbi:DUF397 domain-containing protein [Marinitenerispora sediminis]|uniref:DUF397 domain-containing protein n=1 Tax=Marinitenerispora sediminis TaxID=1931232 RepID=A0A368T6V5_9ACTN|nr:DUF397 domain-containing protein [Marinitenerispora sediminis]RCV50662.1 DUF397 domain-containing protein [Marinitenerispora sediminis]RCV56196.1 DUF397 domain-containing protein [Marinitenerispora sediminis]RCV59427.1 DUF397 domain-containing protein [Marinitenerispora sediminis]
MSPTTPTRFLAWRKSSYSGKQSHCVEVATTNTIHALRDSKNPNGGMLTFRHSEWRAFITSVKHDAIGH